jgi:hypothetical protein
MEEKKDSVLEAIKLKRKKLKPEDETESLQRKLQLQIISAMKLTNASYERMMKKLETHVIETNDDEENVDFAMEIAKLVPFNFTTCAEGIVPLGLEKYAFGVYIETLHRIAIHLAEMWNEKHTFIPVLLLKRDDGTVLTCFKTK